MFAFLMQFLQLFENKRQKAKLTVTVLVLDLLLLLAVQTIIVAVQKTLLSPAVAIVGLVWIFVTASLIWLRGGVLVDGLIAARLTGLEVGKMFSQAINFFFFSHTAITIFFLIVPVWKFWTAYLFLLVILVGLLTSSSLAGKKWNWNAFNSLYYFLAAAVIGVFFLIYGYEFITGHEISLGELRSNLVRGDDWLKKIAIFGLICLIVGFILKTGWRKKLGLVVLAATLLIGIANLGAISESLKKLIADQPSYRRQSAKSTPQRQEPKQVIVPKVFFVNIPAGQVVHSGIYVERGQIVHFAQPEPRLFFLRGKTHELSVSSRERTETYSSSGELDFRGGPQPTTIKVIVLPLGTNREIASQIPSPSN